MKRPSGDRLAATLPEERVDMSWVTLDRICQEKADAEEDFQRELERNGRPLRSSAAALSLLFNPSACGFSSWAGLL